jgi:outer membrane protein assembly factor BamB
MARLTTAVAGVALTCLLAGLLTLPASAEPMWTTYHRDAIRSGDDPEATEPIPPYLAWQSQGLGAPIWSQPLILGSRAYVATVGDRIYALETATGAVVWEKSVGAPVPSTALPCGDITPTVGVVGTPVIDPATNVIYAVADTWNGSAAQHILVGLNLANGAQVVSTPVDPPSTDPKAILQRTALNLDADRVIFGFGGNDGDCSDYVGAVVAAPEGGGAPLYWQVPVSLPSTSGGAIWAPSGPAVGPEGDIYATTGNPVPPEGKPGPYDYSDSVVQLSSSLSVIGSFEPPNWLQEGENDLDLSSAGAELLPGGLLFQAGKDGRGYLINESTMAGKPGASAVFEGQVCDGHGSFGGDAFAGGVIYVACTNGVQALAYDQSARTFSALWQGPSNAFGPPIVSGGLVWVLATGGFSGGGTTLYGLDPSNGVPRYTETLPSPVADHFASPSAAGDRLFVSTGSTVSAYQIAKLQPSAGGTPVTPCACSRPVVETQSDAPTLLHTHLKADKKGRVRIALRCPATADECKGTVTLRAKLVLTSRRGKRLERRTTFITLLQAHFGPAKGKFTVSLQLSRGARTRLHRHHDHLALEVVLTSPGSKTRRVDAVLT